MLLLCHGIVVYIVFAKFNQTCGIDDYICGRSKD